MFYLNINTDLYSSSDLSAIRKNDSAKTTTSSTIEEDIDVDYITGIGGSSDEEDVDEVKRFKSNKTRRLLTTSDNGILKT